MDSSLCMGAGVILPSCAIRGSVRTTVSSSTTKVVRLGLDLGGGSLLGYATLEDVWIFSVPAEPRYSPEEAAPALSSMSGSHSTRCHRLPHCRHVHQKLSFDPRCLNWLSS